MDLGVKISILYDCKVAQSGYNLFGYKKQLTRNQMMTRYFAKEFTYEALIDFIRMERLEFCNKWGPLFYELEIEKDYKDLKLRLSEAELAKKQNNYPDFKTDLEVSWTYNKDGNLVPAILAPNLSIAITATWHLSVQFTEHSKQCLYYTDYGLRKGCMQVFTGKSNKMFCSNNCASMHQQKRIKIDAFDRGENKRKEDSYQQNVEIEKMDEILDAGLDNSSLSVSWKEKQRRRNRKWL